MTYSALIEEDKQEDQERILIDPDEVCYPEELHLPLLFNRDDKHACEEEHRENNNGPKAGGNKRVKTVHSLCDDEQLYSIFVNPVDFLIK